MISSNEEDDDELNIQKSVENESKTSKISI
jgi:hypothetical protein